MKLPKRIKSNERFKAKGMKEAHKQFKKTEVERDKLRDEKYKKSLEALQKDNDELIRFEKNKWKKKIIDLESDHKEELSKNKRVHDISINKIRVEFDSKNEIERMELNKETAKYRGLSQELIERKHSLISNTELVRAEAENLINADRLMKHGFDLIVKGLGQMDEAREKAKKARANIGKLSNKFEKANIFIEGV